MSWLQVPVTGFSSVFILQYQINFSTMLSDNFRFVHIVKDRLKNFNKEYDAIICVIFSALYIESVINEIIFFVQQYEKSLKKNETKDLSIFYKILSFFHPKKNGLGNFDLYNERATLHEKICLIGSKYPNLSASSVEFIEVKHLISIRDSLVHLKPLVQGVGGYQERKVCKRALSYLFTSKKIISDPFARAVFWIDAVNTEGVATWSLDTVKQFIKYLYHHLDDTALSSIIFMHCLRLDMIPDQDGRLINARETGGRDRAAL